MQVALDPDGSSLTVSFAAVEAAVSFLDEVRSSGGFLIVLARQLAQFDQLDVSIEIAGVAHPAFSAAVAQVFPSSGDGSRTAFLVEGWDATSERALRRKLEGGGGDTGETHGVAAVHQVQQLNPTQKAALATRAGRAERQVLLRDNSPQVLQGLLANPRLEAKEVLQIVKSTHANGGLLQRIVGDARWGKNQEVIAAAARNPKTPTPIGTRLVEKLRTSDLRQMGKMSSGLKEGIRRAALREYLKRSGR